MLRLDFENSIRWSFVLTKMSNEIVPVAAPVTTPITVPVRVSIADVPNVSNVKYLANLAHQIPKNPIYEMFQIS